MFSQFVEVNFLYSDRDQDGLLSLVEWIQLFKLMSEVRQAAIFSDLTGAATVHDWSLETGLVTPSLTLPTHCNLKVGKKFSKEDPEETGLINKAAFARIVAGLDLKLSPAMQKNYIDVNWRFVDRALQGRISFGQFLSCYANFLYSYEISQVVCISWLFRTGKWSLKVVVSEQSYSFVLTNVLAGDAEAATKYIRGNI